MSCSPEGALEIARCRVSLNMQIGWSRLNPNLDRPFRAQRPQQCYTITLDVVQGWARSAFRAGEMYKLPPAEPWLSPADPRASRPFSRCLLVSRSDGHIHGRGRPMEAKHSQ